MKNIDKIKEVLKKIITQWNKADVYMVGGCVRDKILGVPIKDIDLCIDLENGAEVFTDYLRHEFSDITKNFAVYPKYGTSKFTLLVDDEEVEIECVMPRSESYNNGPRKPDQVIYSSITQDAERRDFCCNALYENILTGAIFDPTGRGIEDLNKKILETPLDPELTFIDDPLRMLRAVRFSYQKGFTIGIKTREKIKPIPQYYLLSKERCRDEFNKILMTSNPANAIRDLHTFGLLENILPEFDKYWGYDQKSKYHNLTLTEHSLKVLSLVSMMENSCLELRLAAILHDIAKPTCFQLKEDGTKSYHCHEKESAILSRSILRSLKYANNTIEEVATLIENHMLLKQFYNKDTREWTGSNKLTRKIARILGPNLDRELALIEADNISHDPKYCLFGQVDSYKKKLKTLQENIKSPICQPVSGDEIISELSIPEGKQVGEIKSLFQDWFDENPELSKEDLIRKYKKQL